MRKVLTCGVSASAYSDLFTAAYREGTRAVSQEYYHGTPLVPEMPYTFEPQIEGWNNGVKAAREELSHRQAKDK